MHGARAGFNFLSSFFKWKWGLEGGGWRGEVGGGRVMGVDWPTPSEVKIARVW